MSTNADGAVIGPKDFLVELWMARSATTTASREEPQKSGNTQARTEMSEIESTGKRRWIDKCERARGREKRAWLRRGAVV